MRTSTNNLIGACLSVALLAACGGNSGLSASVPASGAAPRSQARFAQREAGSSNLQYAYVANLGSSTVDAYTINPESGVLKSLGAVGGAGQGPEYVAFDPTGKFANVPSYYSNNASGFAVKTSSGALKPVKGSPFAAGTEP